MVPGVIALGQVRVLEACRVCAWFGVAAARGGRSAVVVNPRGLLAGAGLPTAIPP